MNLKLQIRKIQNQNLNFVYKSICELENEELDFQAFKEILNENIANANNLYLIAENENEGLGFISFHTQNLLHHCGKVGEIQEFFINLLTLSLIINPSLVTTDILYLHLSSCCCSLCHSIAPKKK